MVRQNLFRQMAKYCPNLMKPPVLAYQEAAANIPAEAAMVRQSLFRQMMKNRSNSRKSVLADYQKMITRANFSNFLQNPGKLILRQYMLNFREKKTVTSRLLFFPPMTLFSPLILPRQFFFHPFLYKYLIADNVPIFRNFLRLHKESDRILSENMFEYFRNSHF